MQIVPMITGGDECCLLQTIYFTKGLFAIDFLREMSPGFFCES